MRPAPTGDTLAERSDERGPAVVGLDLKDEAKGKRLSAERHQRASCHDPPGKAGGAGDGASALTAHGKAPN
jgi:hypothetical protein